MPNLLVASCKICFVAQFFRPVACSPMRKLRHTLEQSRAKVSQVSLTRRIQALLTIIASIVIVGAPHRTLAAPKASPLSEIIKQGRASINRGQPEHALNDARKAIEIYGNSAEAYFLLGRAQQDIGLKTEALLSYSKAIDLDPRSASAYSNRGLVKGSLGDMKGAIRDFDKAIEVNKGFAAAYLNRGVAAGAMGNSRAALADFNSAIKANPKYTDAYQNRGIAKELIGDIKGACGDWKTAASMGSTEARKWYTKQCSSTF